MKIENPRVYLALGLGIFFGMICGSIIDSIRIYQLSKRVEQQGQTLTDHALALHVAFGQIMQINSNLVIEVKPPAK